MKYFLLLWVFAVTILVSATNGHPSRGAKTFLARLNQRLNKVCAKVNSLEQEVDALSGQEDQVTQLSGAVSDLTQQVIEQGDTISDLTQLVAQQSDIISALEQRIEDLEGQNTPEPTVAFTAVLNALSQEVIPGEIVLFDTVSTNVGDGYNQATGLFMAMRSGLYQFSASAVKTHEMDGNALTLSIMRNGVQEIAGIFADDTVYKDQGAATTLIHLNAGDKVSVQNSASYVNTVTGDGDTMFSGYLIQPDEESV